LATEIEQLLYGRRGTHGVTEFTVSPGTLRLRLTPWEGPGYTDAVFGEARLTSVECYPLNHSDLDPPWDVIGFDSYDLGNGRWRFVLHCDAIEWCFESFWPVVTLIDV
jgi:hypothetical protein